MRTKTENTPSTKKTTKVRTELDDEDPPPLRSPPPPPPPVLTDFPLFLPISRQRRPPPPRGPFGQSAVGYAAPPPPGGADPAHRPRPFPPQQILTPKRRFSPQKGSLSPPQNGLFWPQKAPGRIQPRSPVDGVAEASSGFCPASSGRAATLSQWKTATGAAGQSARGASRRPTGSVVLRGARRERKLPPRTPNKCLQTPKCPT